MPPNSVLRAAQNPFLESFIEAADRKSGAIRTQEQWDRFVRLITARGLVLENEMLWLESIWIDQTRHATAFGHDRTSSLKLEFADFERRLLRQFGDRDAVEEETAGDEESTAAEIERLIGQMSRQCAALDATVSDWKPADEAAMDGSSLRKLLSYVESIAGAHRSNLLGADRARADSERLLATQGAHNLVLQHVEAGGGSHGRNAGGDNDNDTGSAIEWQLRHAGAVHRELQRRRIQRLSWVSIVRSPAVGDHAADRFGHALGYAGGIALGRGKYGEKARPVELVVVPVGSTGGSARAAQRRGAGEREREPVVLTARMKMPMTPQLLEQVWREFAVHRELALSPAVPRCLGYADASTASSASAPTGSSGAGGSDQLYFFYEFVDARSMAWLMARGAEKAAARHAYAAFDDYDGDGLGRTTTDSGSGSGPEDDEDEDEDEDERKLGVANGRNGTQGGTTKRKRRARQGVTATATAAFRTATVLQESSSFFRRWSSDLLRALRDVAGQCTHRIEGRLTLSNAMVSANGRRTMLGRVRWGPAVLPTDADAARRTVTVLGKSFTLPSYFDLREWQLMADYSAMVRAALGPYQPSSAGSGSCDVGGAHLHAADSAPPGTPASVSSASPSSASSASASTAAPASAWPLKVLPLAPPAVQMSFDECASLQRQAQAAGSIAPGGPRRKAGAVRLLTGQSLVVTLPADVNGGHSSWQAPVVLASPRAAQIVVASMRNEADQRVSTPAPTRGSHDAAPAGAAVLTIEAVSAGWAEVSLFCRQPWAPPSSALTPTLRICVEVGEVHMSPELRGMLTCCDDAASALLEWRAVWDAATQHGPGATATEADTSRCAAAASRTTELLTLRQLADHPYFRPAAAGDDDAVQEDFKRAFL